LELRFRVRHSVGFLSTQGMQLDREDNLTVGNVFEQFLLSPLLGCVA
jgi:hypothetical protein